MRFVPQSTSDLLGKLSRLEVDWEDDLSRAAKEAIRKLPIQKEYSEGDIKRILERDFDTGILVVRTFLGLSKDSFNAKLIQLLGPGNGGKKGFKSDPNSLLSALSQIGLFEVMSKEVNRELAWYDSLFERLRSGRGSAVSGQKRGRFVEDFVEDVVKQVFEVYDSRTTFIGQRGKDAKCDFAIPSKVEPSIVIEAKGYDATGSKMTDVIGDIEQIIDAKRGDTSFLLFTDGVSWQARISDFRKIVDFQNQGDIMKIYTQQMVEEFREDLNTLKREKGL